MILQDHIEIHAPGETVWQATIDVESWPRWSPAMKRIRREDSGDFKLGSTALITQKMMGEARWTVVEFDPGNSFTWEANAMGMHMVASHVLTCGESSVTSVLKIKMEGWVVRLFGFLLKPAVAYSLREENRGLKRYCEPGSVG